MCVALLAAAHRLSSGRAARHLPCPRHRRGAAHEDRGSGGKIEMRWNIIIIILLIQTVLMRVQGTFCVVPRCDFDWRRLGVEVHRIFI